MLIQNASFFLLIIFILYIILIFKTWQYSLETQICHFSKELKFLPFDWNYSWLKYGNQYVFLKEIVSKSVNKCPFQMNSLRQSENARYSRDRKTERVWKSGSLFSRTMPLTAIRLIQDKALFEGFCFEEFSVSLFSFYQESWWMCRERRRLKLRGPSELLQVAAVTLAPPAFRSLYLRWQRCALKQNWNSLRGSTLSVNPGCLHVLCGSHHWTSQFALGKK